MENFDPIDIEFLINSEEVKADAKKVKDDIHGIGDVAEATAAKVRGMDGGGIATPLKNAGKAAEEAGKKAAAARPQWNGLGNSINQISRELPAFALSAQTGFLALSNNIPILADEIGRLRTKNLELIASGQQAVPVWKQVVKGMLSWGTALSLGVVILTVYGKEIVDWIGNLFKGKEAIDELKKSQELLNKTFEGNDFKKAIADIEQLRINLDLAKKGMADKKGVVDQYNASIGETAKQAKNLDDVEQGLVKNADLYIEMTLKKAAANLALEDAAQKALELAQESQKSAEEFIKTQDKVVGGISAQGAGSQYGVSSFDQAAYKKSLKEDGERRKKARLDQLEDEKESMINLATNFTKDAAEAAKAMGGILLGGKIDDPKDAKKLSDRKKLLEQIADLDREYARKALDRDGEELQALRDKFLKVRQLIEEFNRDPKNAAKRIDISGLDIIQEKAEEDLQFKQDTEKLKSELQEQRKLFIEIEDFKAKFGVEKTRERYAEELKQYDSYAAAIRQKVVDNSPLFKKVDSGTATAAEIDRVKFLRDQTKGEQAAERERYVGLLEEFMTYTDKRNLLIEQFYKDYNQLMLQKNFEEADVRKKIFQEELDDLDDQHIKKKESYKDLFRSIARMSIAEGKKLIADAKRFIASEILSAETLAKIQKLIDETEDQVKDLQEDEILKAAAAFREIGDELSRIGEEIGSPALSNIGSFLSEVSVGIESVMRVMSGEMTNVDKMAMAITSTIRLFGMVASAAAQRRAAEEDYYRSVIGLQNDYNRALTDQLRTQSELGENAWIKDYEGRITDALRAFREGSAQYTEAMAKLEEGRVKLGQRNGVDWGNVGSGAANGAATGAAIGSFIPVVGTLVGGLVGGLIGGIAGFFGGRRREDIFGSLLGEYPELLVEVEEGVYRINTALAQSLLENNLLDASTAQVVQNILDLEKALEEARAQIREIIVDLTGSLGNDLRDALVDAFESGEDSAIAMGQTVEKVLENILSNMIFNRIFTEAFDKLEEQMAASFDTGGDGSWVDDFSRFFNEASGLTDDFNQALRDAQAQAAGFGFNVFEPEEPERPEGLQGGIRRELTEETASELTGLFRGQFDVTKRHLQLHERHFELEQRNFDVTRQIMQYSALIEQNTAATVLQLQYAVTELKTIATNTHATSARDMGVGG